MTCPFVKSGAIAENFHLGPFVVAGAIGAARCRETLRIVAFNRRFKQSRTPRIGRQQ